jgi:hypothetical protein
VVRQEWYTGTFQVASLVECLQGGIPPHGHPILTPGALRGMTSDPTRQALATELISVIDFRVLVIAGRSHKIYLAVSRALVATAMCSLHQHPSSP